MFLEVQHRNNVDCIHVYQDLLVMGSMYVNTFRMVVWHPTTILKSQHIVPGFRVGLKGVFDKDEEGVRHSITLLCHVGLQQIA